MTEWPKVQHWKCCVLQKGTVGSNPTLSAIRFGEWPDILFRGEMRDGIRQQVWSVYVLFSPSRRRTYVGCAHDVKGRLAQHNAAQVRATCLGVPWTVLLTERLGTYS